MYDYSFLNNKLRNAFFKFEKGWQSGEEKREREGMILMLCNLDFIQ